MQLTKRIESTNNDEKTKLEATRELILDTINQIDGAAKQHSQQASNVLQHLVQAENLEMAIMQMLPEIDDLFMAILSQNYEAAQQAGHEDIATRLKVIGNTIIAVMDQAAPPEVRFVNILLSQEDEESALLMIKQQANELPPEIIDAMDAIATQLRAGGRPEIAERLMRYKEVLKKEQLLAKWQ